MANNTTYRTPSYIFVNDEDNLELAHLPLGDSPVIEGLALLPDGIGTSFTRTAPVQGQKVWEGVWSK